MTFIITQAKWKDPPSEWGHNFSTPPFGFGPEKQKEYQELLNKITGLSRDKPILLLEYGGSAKIYRYTDWDSSGNGKKEIYEPKYKLRRKSSVAVNGEILIPFRRWVISQRCEPEQYRLDSKDDTTYTDEEGRVREVAKKPKELYTPLIYIGDHSFCLPNCCEHRLCPGDYKHPGIEELKWVAEKTHLLKTEMITDPYSAYVTPGQLKKILAENKKENLSKQIEKISQL